MLSPFHAFIKDQATSSVILITCTVIALFIANSSWSYDYQRLLLTSFGILVNETTYSMSLKHWINDALMAVFFFLLGMEIKRELLVGEIRALSRFVPILAAAVGGMILPAAIFYIFNNNTVYASGWGIPMATDTAFAVGILALLGRCIPLSAIAFLTAFAIIDDIGAILVIALFYSNDLNIQNLLLGLFVLGLLAVLNFLGVRKFPVYLLGGALVWLAMLGSGIHATVAGVLVAATVPASAQRNTQWFKRKAKSLMSRFAEIDQAKRDNSPILADAEQHAVVEDMQLAAEKSTTPLRRWERMLEYPVSLLVLPVFALANAGVELNLSLLPSLWEDSLPVGIILGLVVGKGIGIPLFVWLVVRTGFGKLPEELTLSHIVGLGLLGGMGFTMSIFISSLGFPGQHELQDLAKIAILVASLISGCAGFLWLKYRSH